MVGSPLHHCKGQRRRREKEESEQSTGRPPPSSLSTRPPSASQVFPRAPSLTAGLSLHQLIVDGATALFGPLRLQSVVSSRPPAWLRLATPCLQAQPVLAQALEEQSQMYQVNTHLLGLSDLASLFRINTGNKILVREEQILPK